MDEYKRQSFLLIIFILITITFITIYKSDYFWNLGKFLPLHTNSKKCVNFNNNICLANDEGLRTDYYEASSICSKKGMHLPDIEQVWFIWTHSENCQRAFATGSTVPKSKKCFIKPDEENCLVSAMQTTSYCINPPIIKFPIASQYQNGYFWIKDEAKDGYHNAINYHTGIINKFPDNTDTLGVRCIIKKLSTKEKPLLER